MKKIIALTTDGGMIIGKTYEVGVEVASILVTSKRAKYYGLPEEEVTVVTPKPKTTRKRK